MANILYVGDYGFPIPGPARLILDDAPYDPAGDSVTFIYHKPDRSMVSVTPAIEGTIASYAPEEGFINQAGPWKLRIVVITPPDPPLPVRRCMALIRFRVLAG